MSAVAGTGRTGFINVPPNNFRFYHDGEKYAAAMQADGGQLSGTASSLLPDLQHDVQRFF